MKGLYRAIDKSIENNQKLRETLEQSREILQKTKAQLNNKNQPMRILFADNDFDDDRTGKVLSGDNQSMAVIK